ncbi:hypothetical protein [Curtobacterium ammoniigenes]|uniref:hypothetical protein n=1 Tax=Curtobacterium ammoniigenes TaxID=395387 RepID=UPI00082EF20C|nr:hypothetical protein [Curtobacterium ammoniigenes]
MTTTTIALDTARPTVQAGARGVAFDERETVPAWMRAIGALLILAGALLTAAIVAWPRSAPEVSLLLPALAAVVCGVVLVTARTGLTVHADAVVVHIRPFPSRRIALDRIVTARVADSAGLGAPHLGPWGPGSHRVLMLSDGAGLHLFDDRGRSVFVRVAHPEDAIRALIHASGE